MIHPWGRDVGSCMKIEPFYIQDIDKNHTIKIMFHPLDNPFRDTIYSFLY